MTSMIPDIHPDNIDHIKNNLRNKIRSTKVKEAGRFCGQPYFITGDDQSGYVTLSDESKLQILYFVSFKKVKIRNLLFARQVFVWNSEEFESAGFPQQVFFDILLPKFGACISDTQQTRAGRGFWRYALLTAFQREMFVYAVDKRSFPYSLTKLENMQEVGEYRDQIWGDTRGHANTGIAISNKDLILT